MFLAGWAAGECRSGGPATQPAPLSDRVGPGERSRRRPYSGRNPLGEIDWFGRHGFDFGDLTLGPPAADPGQIDLAVVRAALERHGLGVVAHSARFIPLGSAFANIREASLVEHGGPCGLWPEVALWPVPFWGRRANGAGNGERYGIAQPDSADILMPVGENWG